MAAVTDNPPYASTRTVPKDAQWAFIWGSGIAVCGAWNAAFLNAPAFGMLVSAFFHSIFAGIAAVAGAFVLGWSAGVGLHALRSRGWGFAALVVTFMLNIVRSVPQILGLLGGYVILTALTATGTLSGTAAQLLFMSGVMSTFLFLEVADLVEERINHFKALDFYPAMMCCGISEFRIIHVEILWRCSGSHLLQRAMSMFGTALFLQCSVDFIVSVGLSTDVSLSNFPSTLGSLLARLDSKQDILAFGTAFMRPSYLFEIPFQHLQGLSTAFFIVYTLLCSFRAAQAFVRRKGL